MIEKRLQKLPIGIQDFETLRNGNYLYVDKTKDVYEIATEGVAYFLSRPRRFGKSMLCTTLKALFTGKKHLFEGTWIGSSNWQWQEHPVIHLDFNELEHESPADLKKKLQARLIAIAIKHGINLEKNESPGTLLLQIIKALAAPGKLQPVVIIDEYDKPMINNLGNPALFEAYRDVLYNCYTPLKSLDSSLRFLFITGVSQFAKVSIFSALNHLKNLSGHPQAATVCGYTQAELEHNFADYIVKAAKKIGCSYDEMCAEIKRWYNGYAFMNPADAPHRLYNPFSIINFFDAVRLDVVHFKNYWFESGTPSFAIDFFKNHAFSATDFEQVEAMGSTISALVPEKLNLTAVLYQTGYLTIKRYTDQIYELGFPNYEVRASCIDGLLTFVYDVKPHVLHKLGTELYTLFTKDTLTEEALVDVLNRVCSQISYKLIPEKERIYQAILWAAMCTSGLNTNVEDATAKGRIDITITVNNHIFILELKIRGKADGAVQQIIDRRYAEKYITRGHKVTCVGIVIDAQERMITDCKIVTP